MEQHSGNVETLEKLGTLILIAIKSKSQRIMLLYDSHITITGVVDSNVIRTIQPVWVIAIRISKPKQVQLQIQSVALITDISALQFWFYSN